jgi:arylformamidase
MTPKFIDISWPLGPNTPVWPGSPGIETSSHLAMARGDAANATRLTMDVHTGTHVDAPRHFVPDGAFLEELGLEPFVGDAYVARIGDVQEIDADALEAAGIPPTVRRLLLATSNSRDGSSSTTPFREDYAALTPGGAQWAVTRGLALIGIDYLSIQRYSDPPDTHEILLGAGIAILEGLALSGVEEGSYTLVCLPLRLLSCEAAPARAILLSSSED